MSRMPTAIVPANGNGWRVSKEIPIALIISIASSLFLGGIGYQSLKSDIGAITAAQKETREDAKDTKKEIGELTGKLQEGSVPSALGAARTSSLEVAVSNLRGRVEENERKLLRFEAAQVAAEARRVAK